MTTTVHAINLVLGRLFDLLCYPFETLPPVWGLLFLSLVAGVVMLWVFGKVSNQQAIAKTRARMTGNLIGVRLFEHDLRVVLGLQGRILRDLGRYLGLMGLPLLVLLAPMLLLLIQMNLRFDARPLQPGEELLVKAVLREPSELMNLRLELIAPQEIVVSDRVRIPSLGEVAWSVRAEQPGSHLLRVRVGEAVEEMPLVVGEHWGAVPSRRPGTSVWDTLLWPGTPPLPPGSPLASIEVTYPSLPITLLGWHVHWLALFFVASILFGFAFRGVLGVEL